MSTTTKSLVFLAITFAFSWGVAIGGWALGMRDALPALLVMTLMMAGPAVAALICAFAFERGRVRDALGLHFKPNWWWLGAWALILFFAALSVVLTVVLGGRHFVNVGDAMAAQAEAAHSPAAAQLRGQPMLGVTIVAAAAVVGSLINAPILTLTEELGWRGYLHTLWRPGGFWRASIGTGAIWGFWHAPAILLYGLNYPQNREIGVALFVLYCGLLAPLMTLLRDKGRSVIAAGIAHGAMNAVGGLTLLAVSDPRFPWNGIVGIGGFAALALMLGFVAVVQRKPSAA